MPEEMNKPTGKWVVHTDKYWAVAWHEIANSANSNQLGVSRRFHCREAAERWLDDAVAEDIGNAKERGNKITVTWDDGIVFVDEDGGAEVTYQVVEVSNGDD